MHIGWISRRNIEIYKFSPSPNWAYMTRRPPDGTRS